MEGPLRRLALVPDPYPGESLLSWADAIARLNQVSRTEVLRMTGMISPGAVSAVFGYRVSNSVAHAVGETTGVTLERLRSMTLAHYAGRVLDPLPQDDAKEYGAPAAWRYRQRMVLSKCSNVCPSCLRENGGRWLLRWRLAWAFACVRHRRYLISQCRGCGSPLHVARAGDPRSWTCPGPVRRPGQRPPHQACGRDIRRMRAAPVHDTQLLACQQHIDRVVDGLDAPTPEEVQGILGALYRSMQSAWSAVLPLPLPWTDDAVRRAWDGYLLRGGHRDQYQPLLVAAAVKIATAAGLEADGEEPGQQIQARPNWGAPRMRETGPCSEIELGANRFGDRCRHNGCFAWVPAGHGAVLGNADGWDTHCPQHAGAFTVRAQSESAAFSDPCARFLEARLREEEQHLAEGGHDLHRQRIEAQRLILDAYVDAHPGTTGGKSLRYAVRCLLLPYASHPEFCTAWLPRQGEGAADSIMEVSTDKAGRGAVDHG